MELIVWTHDCLLVWCNLMILYLFAVAWRIAHESVCMVSVHCLFVA